MVSLKAFNSGWILSAQAIFAVSAVAFSGNFLISNLAVDCPSERDAASTADSFICFDFVDQDTPTNPPAQCCLQWAAGQTPPAQSPGGTCSDDNVTVCVPDGQYGGFQNINALLGHSYNDISIGPPGDNLLYKFANMSLQYPSTPDYECDLNAACCELNGGATMTAVVSLTSG